MIELLYLAFLILIIVGYVYLSIAALIIFGIALVVRILVAVIGWVIRHYDSTPRDQTVKPLQLAVPIQNRSTYPAVYNAPIVERDVYVMKVYIGTIGKNRLPKEAAVLEFVGDTKSDLQAIWLQLYHGPSGRFYGYSAKGEPVWYIGCQIEDQRRHLLFRQVGNMLERV